MKTMGKSPSVAGTRNRGVANGGRGVHAKAVARLHHEVRKEGALGDWGGGKAAKAPGLRKTYRDPAQPKPRTPGC